MSVRTLPRAAASRENERAMDWGLGEYERTAERLLPAAEVLVEAVAPAPGELLVDVGCGTGSAALIAAARGARVTGVDPAPRLLEVARAEAAERGLDAAFVEGDAASLPLADGEADVVVSAFGVIFAPDAPAAAAELARVTAPAGRIALSAWTPSGPLREVSRAAREAMARATGGPQDDRAFPWHDRDALAALLGPYGFEVATEEHELAFTGDSAEAYFAEEWDSHPLSIAGWAVLEPRGEAEALRERMLAILDAGNEDPHAFRVTSRYIVATARRAGRTRGLRPPAS
jgi:SAM-dependent methyltransferase